MNEILSNAIALSALVAGFAGLVAWVRNDTFTGRSYKKPTDDGDVDTVVPDRRTTTVRKPAPARTARAGALTAA
ncbi:hypothetical protein ABIE44_000236 [Marmoricola sp. OAE513]|uniref:hypothetical protein n=1 Tax=Marmoricola sp. OAE513 TaxID=2817894 RepID=UPI001AE27E63